MTRKFSAEDFANAKFATNDSGSAAHRRHDGWVIGSEVRHTDEQMASAGWVPVQVPGRTITESEAARLWYDANNSVRDAWPMSLQNHGITVTPDPVPTNAELLEEILKLLGDMPEWERVLIAGALDDSGVKAPDA